MISWIGVLAATSAALSFGTADFFGGIVSRRASALSAAFALQLISGAGLALVLLATGQEVGTVAVGLGLVAGLGVGIGLLALYEALAAGAMGVVAVLTGVTATSMTFLYDTLALGRPPSPIQILGIGCALAGSVASTRLGSVSIRVAGWSIVSGMAFGSSFIAFNLAAGQSPISVLFVARIGAALLLGVIWVLRVRRLTFHPFIAVAGVLDTVANLLMMLAVWLIPVSLATAISSADPPIVTMFLARFALGEALPRTAYVSVALACAGIGLILLG